MKLFNNALDVGMKAIIIGTKQPKNSHLIGKIVTVECFLKDKETISSEYLVEGVRAHVATGCGVAVISGAIGRNSENWKEGYRMIDPKHLMPLPPLDELEQQKEQELNLCH